ncbi:MAG: TetR family transcriptional regulator C-terminal domain-containing protein, partial [Caldilineaceae bacterium]|nr:TetR family transcriptional regulator C-terminal domain-containing protein [Caldilineaceae bacterium]
HCTALATAVGAEGYSIEIILRHWSTAQMALTQWWLENGQPIPAAEMARYLWELYESGAVQPLRLPVQQ